MTTTLTPPAPATIVAARPDPATVAAAARNATKTYGSGDAAVHALHDVSVDFESE